MLVFEERVKLEYLEENLLEQNREPTNSAYLRRTEPGTHRWKMSMDQHEHGSTDVQKFNRREKSEGERE